MTYTLYGHAPARGTKFGADRVRTMAAMAATRAGVGRRSGGAYLPAGTLAGRGESFAGLHSVLVR